MPPDPVTDQGSRPSRPPLPSLLPAKQTPSTAASSELDDTPRPVPLPLTQSTPTRSTEAPITSAAAISVPLPPRSQLTRIACDGCRRRRTKCTGDRPRCTACVKYRSECHYQSVSRTETNAQRLRRQRGEAQSERDIHRQFYAYLQDLPESQAQEVLRRVRLGSSVASIVRQIQDGDLLVQMALVPETRMRYEFPYHPGMPLVIRRSNNPYLDSILYEVVHTSSSHRLQHEQQQRQDLATRYSPAYLKPYHAATYVNPLLSEIDVTKWTSVVSDNNILITLLSAYLVHEYPTYPIFQKDIFLQAMIDGDGRYCSKLLVGAVLAAASHCCHEIPDRERYWEPHTLSYRFLAETLRLWELQMGRPSLVNAQAAAILNVVYNYNGLDELGHKYLENAISIGYEIDLFKAEVPAESARMKNARTFAAWSIYRWAVIQGYHFQRLPQMSTPPESPLPDPDQDPEWYGEFHLQYPLSKTPFPMYFGHMFKALSNLRVIVNDIAQVTYGDGDPGVIPPGKFVEFRERLQSWFASLAVPLKPDNIIWPFQFKMHMEYFVILISICQTQMPPQNPPQQAPEDSITTVARKMVAETLPGAVICLETTIRLYYLRHSFEYCDTFMTYFLSRLANTMMEARAGAHFTAQVVDSIEHIRSTLVLCFKGLSDQGRHVHVAAVIFKLLWETQAPEDININGSYISPNILGDRSLPPVRVRSDFPLRSAKGNENSETWRLGNLVDKQGP